MAVQLGWVAPVLDTLGVEGYLNEQFYSFAWGMIRPLGIGTLIGGALMGVVTAFPAIKSAFVSLALQPS